MSFEDLYVVNADWMCDTKLVVSVLGEGRHRLRCEDIRYEYGDLIVEMFNSEIVILRREV